MMTIEKKQEGTTLILKLSGELDTITAPELEKMLDESLDGILDLIFDFEKLAYTSSAGLRVLLKAEKVMKKQGCMKIIHVNEEIVEIFDITGLMDIFTVENAG